MDEKIEEYLLILYPDKEKIDKKESINFERDKKFITENIEEIEKRYKEVINNEETKESNETLIEDNKSENVEEQIENTKEENEEQENLEEDIEANNEELEDTEFNEDLNKKEILENIIKEIKIDKYFELLHPEYDSLNEEEKYYVYDDKIFIRESIDAIDVYYQDCKTPGSGAEFMEWTDKTILQTALKLFNKKEKIFTPNDIEEFSSSVKYLEFKQAITNIKEIAEEEKEETPKE